MRSTSGPLVLIRQISRRIRKCLQELQSAAKHTQTHTQTLKGCTHRRGRGGVITLDYLHVFSDKLPIM